MTVILTCKSCGRHFICRGHKNGTSGCTEDNKARYPNVCTCHICYTASGCLTELVGEKNRKGKLIGGIPCQ